MSPKFTRPLLIPANLPETISVILLGVFADESFPPSLGAATTHLKNLPASASNTVYVEEVAPDIFVSRYKNLSCYSFIKIRG